MKRILIVLLLLAILLPLVSCGGTESVATSGIRTTVEETTVAATSAEPTAEVTTAATEGQTEPEPEPWGCTVRLSTFEGPVPIHTARQAAYLADKDEGAATNYARGESELSRPVPITLSWDVDFGSAENDLWYQIVRIWTKPDGSDAKSYLFGRSTREHQIYNLFIRQRYYWNVTAYGTGGEVIVSDTESFVTESQAPRNLYVDGVTNVRDLGGRRTEDGGRVRQGLLYRGGELNNVNATRLITDEGIRTMRQTFGIKTEFDLRASDEYGGITKSFLGDDVKYLRKSGSTNIVTDYTHSWLIQVFSLLADENNYPIYLHCIIGTDRTGIVSWLVNGLCGVSEEDLWRDFLFSNFGKIGSSREKSKIQDRYVNQLKSAPGDTFAEQIYNYLNQTCGVPASYLDSVIRIMKVPQGQLIENYTYPPAEHTHKAERAFTTVEVPTGTYPGVMVRYCSICGEFVEETIAGFTVVSSGARAQ